MEVDDAAEAVAVAVGRGEVVGEVSQDVAVGAVGVVEAWGVDQVYGLAVVLERVGCDILGD